LFQKSKDATSNEKQNSSYIRIIKFLICEEFFMTWLWIVLLWMIIGNSNCCENNEPMPIQAPPPPQNSGCGCGGMNNRGGNGPNGPMQPRQFAGFGDGNTCGCEEKD
jgi:hypothetical protein